MENRSLYTAAAIAKDRLDQYLNEKLKGAWDESAWEFYTFLLEQANNHKLDHSGYCSIQYQTDHSEAMANCRISHPEHFVSDDKSKKP